MISICHNSHPIERLTMRRRNEAQCLQHRPPGLVQGAPHPPVTWQADCIRVNVTDNVQVAEVRITISDEAGNTLEQGNATHVDGAFWEYATASEGRVTVEAMDPAGNVTRRES